ncbi:calcium-binding protein [Roseovarius sp. CAU 1744]|uniref:calcium-binding protein n=1 Tax=Roseovarius sp. CAU 1744 TaxID=3140368 RepID=UPI00325A8865
MTFAPTLEALGIELDSDFSDAEKQTLLSAFETLYSNPAGRAFLESVAPHVASLNTGDTTFLIERTTNGSQAAGNSRKIEFDFAQTASLVYVDSNGNGHNSSVMRVLLHEMIHAVDNIGDVTVNDLFVSDYDYVGPTVLKTNSILSSVSPSHPSYEPAKLSYTGVSNYLEAGTSYTFGQEVDVAFALSNYITAFEVFGAKYNTSVHSDATRDLIAGTLLDETILTGRANDFVYGFDGNDTVAPGSGNDHVNGGNGGDTVTYAAGYAGSVDDGYTQGLNAVLTSINNPGSGDNSFIAAISDPWSNTDTLVNIEDIIATDFDDAFSLTGSLAEITSDLDLLDAKGNGDNGDTLDLSGATDTAGTMINLDQEFLQSLNNTFDASIIKGFENVVGSEFNDAIIGNEDTNLIEGGAGNDLIDAGSPQSDETDDDTVSGGAGDDTIEGGSGLDSIMGGSGNDVITDSADGATIFGGSGNDDISVEGLGGMLYGGSGNDTIDAQLSDGANIIMGGSGDDTLYGNGQSILTGGSGADTFYIQEGDVITDGEGQDSLYFDGQHLNFSGARTEYIGYEVGPEGNSAFRVGEGSGSKAVVLRINDQALPDDFDGTFQKISYTAYFYIDFVPNFDPDFHVFDLGLADFVISDFRLGDFGIMPQGAIGVGGEGGVDDGSIGKGSIYLTSQVTS